MPAQVRIWKEGEQYNWVGLIREGAVRLTLRTGAYQSRFLFGECLSMFERGLIKSIEAVEETLFTRLSRKDFETHFQGEEYAKHADSIRILKNSVFFDAWSLDALNLVAGLLLSVSVLEGKCLYDTESTPDGLYFVKSGEVRLKLIILESYLEAEIRNYQSSLRVDGDSLVAGWGTCIGVDGILIGANRLYEVITDSKSELLVLDRSTFVSLYNTFTSTYDIIHEENESICSELSVLDHQRTVAARVFEWAVLPPVRSSDVVLARAAEERKKRHRTLSRQRQNERNRYIPLTQASPKQ